MWSFYLTLLICITKEKRKHYSHKNQRRHFPVVFVLIAELRILHTVSKDLNMMKDFCSWSVCLSVCLSVCPSVRPSVHSSIRPLVCPSIRPSIRQFPSIHMYVRLSFWSSNHLFSASTTLTFCLKVVRRCKDV